MIIKSSQITESIIRLFSLNERNVGNIDEVEDFVSEFVRAAQHRESQKWFKTTLRTYLINDYPNANVMNKKSQLKSSGYYQPWMDKAIRQREDIYIVDVAWDDDFGEQMGHVLDYFNQLLDNRENLPRDLQVRDLTRLSVEDAIQKSEDWTKWLSRGNSVEDDTGTKTIMKMGSYTWVEVLSAAALDYEGSQMGHCVGSYSDRVASQQCQIYSLRDSRNEPHVTIEARGKKVIQIKGKQNKEVVEKYWDYVVEFLNKSGLDPSETSDLKNIGMYYQDGKVLREPGPDGYFEVVKRYSGGYEWAQALSPRAKQKLFFSRQYYEKDGVDAYLLSLGNKKLVEMLVLGKKILEVNYHPSYSRETTLSGTEREKTLEFVSEMKFEPANRKSIDFLGVISYRDKIYLDEKDLPADYWKDTGWGVLFAIDPRGFDQTDLPDIAEVERLLRLGADPDSPADEGMTAMQIVYWIMDYSDSQHEETMDIIELLLRHGADINATDDRGGTILHYAASGTTEYAEDDIRWFVGKGANVNARDHSGNTPLNSAIDGDHVWHALALVELGANITEGEKRMIIASAEDEYEEDLVDGIARDLGIERGEEDEEDD